jgi:uncharacterized membrane-anchored protein
MNRSDLIFHSLFRIPLALMGIFVLVILSVSMMERVNKVAQITVIFWIMKIIATTLGETLGDFISMTLHLGYLTGLLATFVFFMVVLLIQLRVKRYIPVFFWLVIIATTTLGTELSDFMDRSLHMGYTFGSVILSTCLIITLFIWYKTYGNLKVVPINERNKELFYWAAILFSNSLGTAFGDYLSDVVELSYLQGALVTSAVILAVLLIHYFTKINQILLFWIAFVFTRPFGATFGDFLTKPIEKGGLDLGTFPASAVSMLLMAVLIVIAHRRAESKVGG